MAEFKTAEQYVVEKVEYLENELDRVNLAHKLALEEANGEIDMLKEELVGAYELINTFRDYLYVTKDNYFGNCVRMEIIYGKEHPDDVARLMEYFDMRPDEEDNKDA